MKRFTHIIIFILTMSGLLSLSALKAASNSQAVQPSAAAETMEATSAPATRGNTSPNNLSVNKQTETGISPEERASIETIIHDYLLKNPEVLKEAIQRLQQKEFQQAANTIQHTQQIAAKFSNALFHHTPDPVAGNPLGNVTITEFFDYQCGHCINMATIIDNILKDNPNVRVVFKQFPIQGPLSDYAARAALAANKQGKYLEFHRALFNLQLNTSQHLTEESILKVADQVGLNRKQLLADMQSPAINNVIHDNLSLVQTLKLFGTPAFFIGLSNLENMRPVAGKNEAAIYYVPGRMDQARLQELIDKLSKIKQ